MTRRISIRTLYISLAVLAALTLAACHGAGTLPAGQAYLTIYNPNTSTTNTENYYSQIIIDGKPATPSIIYAGGQQNYVVTAPATHQLELNFTDTAGHTQGLPIPAQLSVPAQGCIYTGPTTLGGPGSGC